MDNVELLERDYPILATKGVALFPHNEINIEAGRLFSKNAISKAKDEYSGYLIVVPQFLPFEDKLNLSNISKIGTVAKIKTVRNFANGLVRIVIIGLFRVEILSIYMNDGSYFSSFKMVNDISPDADTEAAYVREMAKVLQA